MMTETAPDEHSVPLVVDLDGTLVSTDLALESIFILAKKKPLRLLRLFLSLVHGLAQFKRNLAKEIMPDPHTLPYDRDFLAYLRHEKQQGRQLILATGADESVAQAVAKELGIFDAVFAADGTTNLTRATKRAHLVAEFGERGFDYAGHDHGDCAVWRVAHKAILVRPATGLREAVAKISEVDRVFGRDAPGLDVYLHALRLHHWIKNALVFVPLLAAHQLYDITRLAPVAIAFVAFCLSASSIYLLNDLLDLPDDRLHPHKRLRMLASGQLSLGRALALAPTLIALAFALALVLPRFFLVILGLYYALMLAYCFRLRGLAVVDALAVAAGYGLRIVAGAVAAGIAVSLWETIFCFLFFFGLTLLKRYAELVTMRSVHGITGKARAYLVQDSNRIAIFGCTSGYLSLLVMAFYINIEQKIYPRHEVLWFTWVLLLYWVSYMWLMAGRGRINGDPVGFALKDRTSQIAGALVSATVLIAA